MEWPNLFFFSGGWQYLWSYGSTTRCSRQLQLRIRRERRKGVFGPRTPTENTHCDTHNIRRAWKIRIALAIVYRRREALHNQSVCLNAVHSPYAYVPTTAASLIQPYGGPILSYEYDKVPFSGASLLLVQVVQVKKPTKIICKFPLPKKVLFLQPTRTSTSCLGLSATSDQNAPFPCSIMDA